MTSASETPTEVPSATAPFPSETPSPVLPSETPSTSIPTAILAPEPLNLAGPSQGIAPLLFIENVGQFDPQSKFEVRGGRASVHLANDALWFTLLEPSNLTGALAADDTSPVPTEVPGDKAKPDRQYPRKGVHLKLDFVGANPNPNIEPFGPIDTTISYILGDDPLNWYSDVPAWSGVRYVDLYPGVDLELQSQAGLWAWRLVVRDSALFEDEVNGAARKGIRVHVEGHGQLSLDEEGNLSISTAAGSLALPIPSIVLPEGVSLDSRSLAVIVTDKELILLSPLAQDTPTATGTPTETESPTSSPTIEITPSESPSPTETQSPMPSETASPSPSQTATVVPTDTPTLGDTPTPLALFDPGAGRHGLSAAIAAVPAVIGPSSPPASPPLDPADLIYSTYLGGTGDDHVWSIAVDALGYAYVAGWTPATDFPVKPGSFDTSYGGGTSDVFVTKMRTDGTERVYSTFLGGAGADGYFDTNIAVDASGAAYITGVTASTDFPTTANAYDQTKNGAEDAFLTKLNAPGTLPVYSTFFGGAGQDIGHGIALETSSAVYVTGMTKSSDFPTSTWALDRTLNGAQAVFVAKLNPNASGAGSLVYSTLLDGSDSDQGHDIAVLNGYAYVAGQTHSTDFPTRTGSYDQSANGSWDAFVAKVNTNGSDLVYSTYLGGSLDDCEEAGDFSECGIAVDSNGLAVVTGDTWSSNFPTINAMDASLNGLTDAFVTKLPANGSTPIFSTYLGGTAGEASYAIDYDSDGAIYLVGTTSSSDFSTTANAYDRVFGGPYEAFLVKLTSTGSGGLYSTYLGGGNEDKSFDVALDATWAAYVTGATNSTDFPTSPNAFDQSLAGSLRDGFVTKITLAAYNTIIYDLSTSAFCNTPTLCKEGQQSPQSAAQGGLGDPINTRTGAFDYSLVDISIPTSAGDLTFQRTYSSVSVDRFTSLLGDGWTHDHDIRLVFGDDPGGELGAVLLKATSTNFYRFLDNGNGTYSPTAGVLSTLTRDPGPPIRFTIKDPSQGTYVFDQDGVILSWNDPQGHGWAYSYVAGKLDRITDDTGQRYMELDYDGSNRIQRVADQTGRDVSFAYNGAGDLATITDVLDDPWTLTYDGAHRLRLVEDSTGLDTIHTEYDAQGRAYRQYDPSGTLVLEVSYNADGTAVATDAQGNQTIDAYDGRHTFVSRTDAQTGAEANAYDRNFRPTRLVDENGNVVKLAWSSNGANLALLTDGENAVTNLGYDSYNNLTSVTDPRNYPTTYIYDVNNPDITRRTLLLEVEDAFTISTTFTYTTSADAPQPPGLLKTITDPLNSQISFVYDEFGQRTSSTDPLGKTTYFTYDSLGRLKTVEDPLHNKTWTCYDPAGRIGRTVANATGNGGTPQTDPCNAASYQPSSDPAMDRISSTTYDDSGHVIATTDPAGVVTRTYFDSDGRPEYVVQNLIGQAIEVPTPPTYDTNYPDRNVRTQTIYDADGYPIATIDTLGIITRTYYDSLHRAEYVVVNLVGQDISVNSPPTYSPSYPDRNVRTQSFYDAAGNLIGTKDNGGHVTRTYYDGANRPVAVVQNLTGQSVYDAGIPSRPPAATDQNLRTDTTYDASGNAIATTDAAGTITRTYYDAVNRPIIMIQNLYGQAISVETPPTPDPLYPYRNVRTDYYYDIGGNQIAVVDPLGVVTRTYYDNNNRPEYVVANLYGQDISVTTPPAYNPSYPDRNVRTQTVYDDTGRSIATPDTNGVITRTYYDALGRIRYVVRNLTGQAISLPTPPAYNPANPDENFRTETTYDSNGDPIANTDNAGVITRTYYDDLHRARYVTQNLIGQGIQVGTPPTYNPTYPDRNVTTETIYDGLGSVVKAIDPIGKVSYSCYDGQRRPIKMIENPSVSSPCGSYTASVDTDRDIIAFLTYDDSGNRKTQTDPNGKVTSLAYDSVNRLASETDPLIHATSYGYDVIGNRVTMTDAKGVITKYEYDALSRLTAVVENYKSGQGTDSQTNVRTEYTYDFDGNRKTIKNARTYTTTFTYDSLSRLKTESDPLSHATTYGYDGVGNRVSLLDANGFTTSSAYDDLGRQTGVDYTSPDADVTFTYDSAGNRHTMLDGAGTTTWTHDALNRATAVQDPYGATVGYGYNGAGLRTSLTYPDTKRVNYSYDLAGRLYLATDWDTLVTTYTYERASQPATTTLPNAIVSTYAFDDAGRLTSLAHVRNSKTLSSFTYTYDEVGNRTRLNEFVVQASTSVPDLVFANGFESGNFSGWSSATTDGGDLSVTTPAAMAGTYGMQALLDDNNAIYVTDTTPAAETRYRARFYFDPNSIPMASGDAHYVFQALNSGGTVLARVEFRYFQGDYQIRAEAVNDSTGWSSTGWYKLWDQMHYIEIDWKAATAAGANNGVLTLWLDGITKQGFTNIDNDTRRVDTAQLGAVSGVDTGSRGTYFLDAFESRRSTFIGPDENAPQPPPPPAPSETIFANGFESGTLTSWSASATDGGNLSVSTQSAMGGTYGMQAYINDNNSIYVTDWSPFEENRYRVRFYFDPNSIPMAHNDAHYLSYMYQGTQGTATLIGRLEMRFSAGDYQIRAESISDTGYWYYTSGWFTITDALHYIELDWKAATAVGANNGAFTLWIDGAQKYTVTTADTDTRRVDWVQLGAVAGVDAGTRGTEFFDTFESRRSSYIGADPTAPTPQPPPTPSDDIFSDGFESGSFSAWSLSVTDGGDLSVTAPAAMVGAYGMQAVMDDSVPIYVQDYRPYEETRYRARFYVDPNSVPLASGASRTLLDTYDRNLAPIARVYLTSLYGDYRISAAARDDQSLEYWTGGASVAITDGPHAIEIEWKASTGPGANNGVITLWIDGTQVGTTTNVDNDTRRVDLARFGTTSSGASGTLFLDAFVSRRQTYIGPDAGGPQPPPWPTKTDALFSDGFESGTFSAWTLSTTDGGDLSVSTASHIVGTYGMSALFDDNNNIYVTDYKPRDENHLRVRFYFDPNSVPMANADSHFIFQALGVLLQVPFRFTAGDYQIRVETRWDNGTTWSMTPWVPLTDGPHAIELEWKAATSPAAGNGVMTLWVDGTQKSTFTNIDNDAQLIQGVDFGPYTGIDTGTRGTTYFDAYESRRDTYIGTDPSAPTPPPVPTPTENIFADGFESGNFSAWSYNATDAGDLSVTTSAALAGTYGMSSLLDDNNSIYVEDWKPYEDAQHRQRFYFDPNTITMVNNDAYHIFQALNRDATVVERIEFRRFSSTYQVKAEIVTDGATWWGTSYVTISDAPHYFETNWKASTGPGSNNGFLTFWVDGVQQGNITGIDNDTLRVEQVRLGAVSGVDTGSRGTTFFDTYESRRTTYIGPIAGLLPNRWMARAPFGEKILAAFASLFLAEPGQPDLSQEPTPEAGVAFITETPIPPALGTPAPPQHRTGGHTLAALSARPVAQDDLPAPEGVVVARIIDYTYDPLYRLTNASYNDGTYYTYTYDAVGNRLTEVTQAGTTTYVYDNANRLTSVNGVTYTWDNNGNLLSDGSSTYTYNHADRLTSVVQGGTTYGFTYNGQGDRVRQTINGSPTTYALDLEGGLTQVLADGSSLYLYGAGRIGEKQTGGWRYHTADALGSVRQLVDPAGTITLARGYAPFGNALYSDGSGSTVYNFTGEQRDGTGMTYLRARYYSSYLNQWIQPDPIVADPYTPADWNRYPYVRNNPINYTDPSGLRITSNVGQGWQTYDRFDKTLPYMLNEMLTNSQSGVVRLIWWLNQSRCSTPDDYSQLWAISLWTYMVRQGGPWDHKPNLEKMLDLPGDPNDDSDDDYYFPIRGDTTYEYYYDIWSNIHYGFVGLAAGFDEASLQWAHQSKLLGTGSSDPADVISVAIGIDLWRDYSTKLTGEQLRWAIIDHRLDWILVQTPPGTVILWTNGR